DYTVAEYQKQAQGCIEDIQSRGKLPILTGGSGLYYQAVVDNYDFLPLDGQPEVRRRLEQRGKREGLQALYGTLKEVDPIYAGIIGGNDRKRIIRALEVYEITGKPFSQTQRKQSPNYDLISIGLTMERALLYERIESRVDRMLSDGLLEEVEALRRRGYSLRHKALNSLGYRQTLQYLEGKIGYDDMVNRIKMESRRFAKRQLTWFKRDERIQWIGVAADDDTDDIYKKISNILAKELFLM
ncbi:MAG: tRNA (adenosine(37)-N6)-dimethylallyltransferase MiaA, partial [Syntrophomonadaceae bacterium]|nr:tRNA (adenosine(37)-N6)-dimethylallyltransferase MiaA [Syntrophomonadaceae bacterium]